MDVRLPSGQVIRGVPEGTTKEQIMQKAIAAGIAKESDFAQPEPPQTTEKESPVPAQFEGLEERRARIAAEESAEGAQLPEIGAAPELNELSMPAFRSSLALLTTGDDSRLRSALAEQFGDDVSFREDEAGSTIVDLPSGSFVLNRPGLSGQDVIRGIFDIAAFTPAGAASSIPRAVAAGAATQAGIEGAASQTGAGTDLSNVALAGALGGVGKGVEQAIGAGARIARGRIAPEQQAILDEAERQGTRVLTTDVLPPETLAGRAARYAGEIQPLTGTGSIRAAQQQARQEAVDRLSSEVTPQYSEVVQSLQRQTSKVKRAAGDRLGGVAQQLDEVGNIPVRRTTDKIDEVIADLTREGRVPDTQTVDKLVEYKSALEKGQTFRDLDTLRSDFREQVRGDISRAFPNRSQAQVQKIYDAMTQDLEASVKANLGDAELKRWKAAKGVYAQEANKVKNTRLKQILQRGDTTPEQARNVLLSNKPSEIKALYKSLDAPGKEAARGTILAEAISKATNAEGVVSPSGLATQLGKLKSQTDILFPGMKGKQLQAFTDYLNATRRAQDAPVFTPTGQSLTALLGGYAAFTDLATTAGASIAAGSMARAYESAPVRNALLKLASTPKGSAAYDAAIENVSRAVTATAQAARED